MKEFVKGRTTDEKFKSINATLKHFSRRLQRVFIGLVPSSPVFKFVYVPESSGVALRVIFPAPGRISRTCIFVTSREGKGPVVFDVEIASGERKLVESFEVKKSPLLFNPNTPVRGGDRWTLSVREPDRVKGIWIGFLYEVDYRALGKETFPIEQLEGLLEEVEDATDKEG